MMAPFPFAIVALGVELQLWLSHHQNRSLKLTPRKIVLSHTKFSDVPWPRILACQFEKVGAEPGYLRFTTIAAVTPRNLQRRWSIMLKDPDQITALRHAFSQFGQDALLPARITDAAPSQNLPAPPNARPMWWFALSFFFFIHGFPLLWAGLAGPQKSSSSTREPLNPEALKRWTAVFHVFHVHSLQDIRRLFAIIGFLLTSAAVACFFLDKRQAKIWKNKISASVFSS